MQRFSTEDEGHIMTTPVMEHARDCALIAAFCSLIGVPIVLTLHIFSRLFLWMQGHDESHEGERERIEMAEAVRRQVAAQVRRRVDAALTFVMFIGTLCCNPLCPYTCRNKL